MSRRSPPAVDLREPRAWLPSSRLIGAWLVLWCLGAIVAAERVARLGQRAGPSSTGWWLAALTFLFFVASIVRELRILSLRRIPLVVITPDLVRVRRAWSRRHVEGPFASCATASEGKQGKERWTITAIGPTGPGSRCELLELDRLTRAERHELGLHIQRLARASGRDSAADDPG